jgi:hypothetical protein
LIFSFFSTFTGAPIFLEGLLVLAFFGLGAFFLTVGFFAGFDFLEWLFFLTGLLGMLLFSA